MSSQLDVYQTTVNMEENVPNLGQHSSVIVMKLVTLEQPAITVSRLHCWVHMNIWEYLQIGEK